MRNFTLLLLTAFLFTNCTRYQYITLSAKEMTQNEQQEFVTENDSVKITYNFNGFYCPVKITVQNKSASPIYINWKKSALIASGKAISYYSPSYALNGSISGYSIQWNNTASQSASVNAAITGSEGIEFIPPHAYITKKPAEVQDNLFEITADSSFIKAALVEDGIRYNYRMKKFTEENSPLVFRSYLTILSGDILKDTSIENTFYIKELKQAYSSPQNFIPGLSKRGDTYFVNQATGFGTGAAAAALIGGGIAVGVVANNKTAK